MDTIRFIHLSDIHYLKSYSKKGIEGLISRKQHPGENVKKCLQDVKNMNLDFVLITGDLTHDGNTDDYTGLKDLLEEQLGEIPYIVIPGNHDTREAFSRVFYNREAAQRLDRVYEINGLRIIGLDTGDSMNGSITGEQLDWLAAVLSKPGSEGSLLVLHHPLINGQDGIEGAEYDKVLVRIIQNSDIMGIFCGHTHHNYFSQFAGKPYFTADSIAFSMTGMEDRLLFEDHAAYTFLTLQNGVLSAQVKQVIPPINLITSFSLDKLSQLFKKEREDLK